MKSTISKEVLRSSHKTKRARRQQILMDKIVNPQTEPTLYNVQSATMAVMAKTSPFSNKKPRFFVYGNSDDYEHCLGTVRQKLFAITIQQHEAGDNKSKYSGFS